MQISNEPRIAVKASRIKRAVLIKTTDHVWGGEYRCRIDHLFTMYAAYLLSVKTYYVDTGVSRNY